VRHAGIEEGTVRRREVSRVAIPLLTVIVLMLGAAPAAGADGDLDISFGDGGRLTTDFPTGSFATAVAVQTDGKVVAVGAAAGASTDGEFAIARYEPDGDLDTTFGDGGTVVTPIAGGNGDEARSVAIQQNGRIVVAGTDSWRKWALVRYRPDGTLDDAFGGNGIVRTNFTPGDDVAWDLAIQPDGKIVAVGAAGFGQQGFQLARYRRDGGLDRSFGDDGLVVTRYHRANARTVVLQPDGRIVVAGYNSRGLALARYRRDGRLDRTFSGNGTVGPVVWGVFALAVAVQPNGRIVLAGDFDIFAFGLARFLPDGRLDRSFGHDGVVRESVEGAEQGASGIVIQPDGRIVATGSSGPHESGDATIPRFVLIRRLADGHRDTSFGVNGEVTTFFVGGARAHGSAVDTSGRIVVVGGSGEGSIGSFALARYLV
jgi:uncharacterized delta-60 repeat protein